MAISLNTSKVKSTVSRILEIVSTRKLVFISGVLCMAGFAGANASIPILLGNLMDAVIEIKSKNEMPTLQQFLLAGSAIVVLFGMRGSFYFGQNYLLNIMGQFLLKSLRHRLFSKVVILPFQFFQRKSTGDILSRFTTDLNIVEQAVYVSITGPIRDLPTIIFFLALLLYINSVLFLFSLLMIPPVLLIINIFGKNIKQLSRKKQRKFGDLVSNVTETITGIQVVKSFHKEQFEERKFKKENNKLFDLTIKSVFISSSSVPAIEMIGAICLSTILSYGSYQLFNNEITGGELLKFVTAFYMLNEPIKRFNGFHLKLQEGLAAAERVFEVIDGDNPIIENNRSKPLPPLKKELRIKIDKFSYTAEQEVLCDIDITIPAGKVVALVGSSGSGKSTLANLLPRFFDLEKNDGGIYIDGNDIRDFDVYSLRKQIAVVDQNTILFNDSVKNNIAYGSPDFKQEELINVAKYAHAYDFIMELPKQFDQVIGEKGVLLSGGQRQRLSIARALFKNSPILILDEATSSLDSESEKEVQSALENLMRERTTLIIAHRFSTLRNADNIFVLKEGRIVEEGTHAQLMEAKGEYFRLFSIQYEYLS